MKNVKYYRVAGLDFRLLLPGGMDADELLPSFRNFKTMDGGSLIFSFNAAEGILKGWEAGNWTSPTPIWGTWYS